MAMIYQYEIDLQERIVELRVKETKLRWAQKWEAALKVHKKRLELEELAHYISTGTIQK